MELRSISDSLMMVNPTPIFFALIGRLLDIYIGFVALQNPLNYEANPLGVHVVPYILIILVASFVPQLLGMKRRELRSTGIVGSYLVAAAAFIPVINSLMVMSRV